MPEPQQRWMIDVAEPDYGSIIAGPTTEGRLVVVPESRVVGLEAQLEQARQELEKLYTAHAALVAACEELPFMDQSALIEADRLLRAVKENP